MGKNFNQWLNEFVDNGADAKDVTNWPKNAGGGQGGGGSNYVMATMDYYQVVGKHIDVDSLIALLEKYDTDLDTELNPEGNTSISIGFNDQDYSDTSIRFGYNVCSGGAEIIIFTERLDDLEQAYTLRTILTANKEKIESLEITNEIINKIVDYNTLDNIVINKLNNYIDKNYLTIQEALSIFK